MSPKQLDDLTPKTRTSVLKKSIKRTLSTAQFETLVIEDGFEEIIEWTTLEERHKKAENWDRILIERFKHSHDRILDELGFVAKKAWFKNPSAETIQKVQTIKAEQESCKKPNLDVMDTV